MTDESIKLILDGYPEGINPRCSQAGVFAEDTLNEGSSKAKRRVTVNRIIVKDAGRLLRMLWTELQIDSIKSYVAG
jgi:hypothetical protein